MNAPPELERSVRERVARARAEDQRPIRRHRSGDPLAREILVERYVPLARSLALRYRPGREPLEDLVQVAAVAREPTVADPGHEWAEARIAVEPLTRLLDHRAREMVLLRFQQDLTQSEIGERTGVSEMRVSRILRSALKKLCVDGFASAVPAPLAAAS